MLVLITPGSTLHPQIHPPSGVSFSSPQPALVSLNHSIGSSVPSWCLHLQHHAHPSVWSMLLLSLGVFFSPPPPVSCNFTQYSKKSVSNAISLLLSTLLLRIFLLALCPGRCFQQNSRLDRLILDAEFCSPEQAFYPVGNDLLDLDHSFHLLRRSFRRLTFGEGFGGKNVFGELPDTMLSRRRAKISALCVCSHRSLTTRSYRLGVISCFKSSWLRSDLAACFVPIFISFVFR
jgi:hypothetical protein